ncbi:MAG: AI-2E family transporter [Balneolaceae bacterium]|nr:AI-2E family transporter [Balneolaceae bacterium]
MNRSYPAWLKGTAVLVALFVLVQLLVYGKFILMPLAFAAFFAMLLDPLRDRFERWKLGRVGSILLSLLAALVVVAGLVFLLSTQIVQFADRLPEANERIQQISEQLTATAESLLGITPERQIAYMEQGLQQLVKGSGEYLSTAVGATTSVFTTLGLLPIFVFFMMYYRNLFRHFLHLVTSRRDSRSVDSVISDVQDVTQNYIIGMMTVISILAALNAIGLWIIGLENALFFAVFAAVLAVIPYIGIILGSIPAILWALLFSQTFWDPVAVIGVFAAVQFLEGNFITPNVIGSRVSINPFMALVALIIGGQIWGIAGMILFVPFLGILRCIFLEVEALKPYGFLLGGSADP